MALSPVDGGSPSDQGGTGAYIPIASVRTFRVLSDNSTQPIQQVTAQSKKYGVQATFFISAKTWDTDGGPPFVADTMGYVDDVCGLDHVVGFRTEQDLDASQLLVNMAVITVGTEDGAITDEARVRMDQLRTGAAVPAIDAVWKRLQSFGAQ